MADPFRAIGVARPIHYPDQVVIEYHVIDPETGKPTGKGYESPAMSIDEMWLAYRPVHIDDRQQIMQFLAAGEKANLGEVEVRDMQILEGSVH